MRNNTDNTHGGEGNTVRLRLPATVDNFHLASLLNPLLENQQYRICLDVSRVSHLGTVEFRVLRIFAESCKRHGGFLKLENASTTIAALVREFGFTELMRAAPG
jgi:anti-anti-sigma regulatory factor